MIDDPYAPVPAHEALLRRFTATRAELRVVRPADVGQRAVGHFGFFRPAMRDALWSECAAWLAAALGLARREEPADAASAGSGP
jgi:predicted alpha/beta hydrolase